MLLYGRMWGMKLKELSKKMRELGKIGGLNRAKLLSPERRSEIARMGGIAKQNKLKGKVLDKSA